MPPKNYSNENHCPGCGASVQGGRDACQALFDDLALRAYSNPGYAAVQTLAFDTYCMQHPERYCVSAKSFAAHLMRLCCGLEFGGDPDVYRAIQQWLNGRVPLEKPELPEARGTVTIADVGAAQTLSEHQQQVRLWAESVWAAYVGQHDLADLWVRAALEIYHPGRVQE